MASETKYSPLFLSKTDEALFETKLKEAIPDLVFVDGSQWQNEQPPEKPSLSGCRKRTVFLWSRVVCRRLPCKKYDNGITRGPTSGVVIQWIRGSQRAKLLSSGDMSVGFQKDNLPMKQFVEAVWKVLRSLNCATLCGFDPKAKKKLDRNIKNYIVGPGARQLSLKGGQLRHCAVDVYYKVESSKNN
jgi:hypothetical protein